jgi:hypothetical protein
MIFHSPRVQLTCSQDYGREGVVAQGDQPSHTPARSDWFKLPHFLFPCHVWELEWGGRCGFDSEPRNSPLRLVLSHNSQHTPDPTLTILQLEYPHDIPQELKVRPRCRRSEADTLDASGKIFQLVASRVDNTSIEKLARPPTARAYLFSQRFYRHCNIQSTAESYASDSPI